MSTCHFFQSLSMIGITETELLYGTSLFIPSLLEGSTRHQPGTPGNIYCMVVEYTFGILKTHVWVGRAKAGEEKKTGNTPMQHSMNPRESFT